MFRGPLSRPEIRCWRESLCECYEYLRPWTSCQDCDTWKLPLSIQSITIPECHLDESSSVDAMCDWTMRTGRKLFTSKFGHIWCLRGHCGAAVLRAVLQWALEVRWAGERSLSMELSQWLTQSVAHPVAHPVAPRSTDVTRLAPVSEKMRRCTSTTCNSGKVILKSTSFKL